MADKNSRPNRDAIEELNISPKTGESCWRCLLRIAIQSRAAIQQRRSLPK